MVAVVVGGSFFGDNLSFISDTTIASTKTQECVMRDKFRVNSMIVVSKIPKLPVAMPMMPLVNIPIMSTSITFIPAMAVPNHRFDKNPGMCNAR